MIRETFEHLGRSPLTEKHKSMVSTMDAFDGPNAQDGAERPITATGHLFEDVMAIGVAGEVLADHPTSCGLSEGFGKKYGEEHLQRDLSSFPLYEDVTAFYHPLRMAGEAGTSSPARPHQCIHHGRRGLHTWSSSVRPFSHFRVLAIDRRQLHGAVLT